VAARWRALLPPLAAFAAYAVWVAVRPAATADDNLRVVLERGTRSSAPRRAGWALAAAFGAGEFLAEAWAGALLLFWWKASAARHPGRNRRRAGLGGWLRRVAGGKPDAWMVGAYLATFLLWPFYDQMTRFLFPCSRCCCYMRSPPPRRCCAC